MKPLSGAGAEEVECDEQETVKDLKKKLTRRNVKYKGCKLMIQVGLYASDVTMISVQHLVNLN